MIPKQVFRCSLTYLNKAYSKSTPANIFLRAYSKEQAIKDSKVVMDRILVLNGLPKTDFSVEVFQSSEEEAKEFSETDHRLSCSLVC